MAALKTMTPVKYITKAAMAVIVLSDPVSITGVLKINPIDWPDKLIVRGLSTEEGGHSYYYQWSKMGGWSRLAIKERKNAKRKRGRKN